MHICFFVIESRERSIGVWSGVSEVREHPTNPLSGRRGIHFGVCVVCMLELPLFILSKSRRGKRRGGSVSRGAAHSSSSPKSGSLMIYHKTTDLRNSLARPYLENKLRMLSYCGFTAFTLFSLGRRDSFQPKIRLPL